MVIGVYQSRWNVRKRAMINRDLTETQNRERSVSCKATETKRRQMGLKREREIVWCSQFCYFVAPRDFWGCINSTENLQQPKLHHFKVWETFRGENGVLRLTNVSWFMLKSFVHKKFSLSLTISYYRATTYTFYMHSVEAKFWCENHFSMFLKRKWTALDTKR